MGGISVNIAIKLCEKFIEFTSHCGYPSLNGFEDYIPIILNESNPAGPPYTFHPNNGITTPLFLALVAAWLPDTLNPDYPACQVDFPIDSVSGELTPEIFDSL